MVGLARGGLRRGAATGNTPFTATPADFIDVIDPKLTQVDTWIAITPENKVIMTHGQAEFDQGTPTGILHAHRGRN